MAEAAKAYKDLAVKTQSEKKELYLKKLNASTGPIRQYKVGDRVSIYMPGT